MSTHVHESGLPAAGALRGAGVPVRAAATVVDLVLLFLVFLLFDALWGGDEPGCR